MVLYVLKLEHDKWYIGKTNNLEARIQQHIDKKASSWTREYPITSVEEIIEDDTSIAEDTLVKRYMFKHGVNNVRGGSYSRKELTPEQIESLRQEYRSATDACFSCGSRNHFANECPENLCLDCGLPGHYAVNCPTRTCFRCGTIGHIIEECEYDEDVCYKCKKPGHKIRDCDSTKNDICHRCRQRGHWEYQCREKKNDKRENCDGQDTYGRPKIQRKA
jgi:predicted GIY-YIG superfamily endonuclease